VLAQSSKQETQVKELHGMVPIMQQLESRSKQLTEGMESVKLTQDRVSAKVDSSESRFADLADLKKQLHQTQPARPVTSFSRSMADTASTEMQRVHMGALRFHDQHKISKQVLQISKHATGALPPQGGPRRGDARSLSSSWVNCPSVIGLMTKGKASPKSSDILQSKASIPSSIASDMSMGSQCAEDIEGPSVEWPFADAKVGAQCSSTWVSREIP